MELTRYLRLGSANVDECRCHISLIEFQLIEYAGLRGYLTKGDCSFAGVYFTSFCL